MMKTFALAFTAVLTTASAFAHISAVPHEHPHAGSLLPDLAALGLAALLVALGAFALRRTGKERS